MEHPVKIKLTAVVVKVIIFLDLVWHKARNSEHHVKIEVTSNYLLAMEPEKSKPSVHLT